MVRGGEERGRARPESTQREREVGEGGNAYIVAIGRKQSRAEPAWLPKAGINIFSALSKISI